MVTCYKVPDDIANAVESWVTSSKIPWFYFNNTLSSKESGRHPVQQEKYILKDLPRLSHYFFPNSKTPQEDNKYIIPLTKWVIQELLPEYEVRRVMGNLTTKLSDGGSLLNLPHVDSDDTNKYSFLYYVNTSDGKTVFFKDGKLDREFDPIKGTGVLFPSNTVHAGQLPCLNNSRYVINIVFSKRV